jgi:hypothetical protein
MSGQNRSSAVMQQRRADGVERRAGRTVAPKELEYFPTPPWATRAICEWLEANVVGHGALKTDSCWEPCCGEGHMARPLAEYFGSLRASDVHQYGGTLLGGPSSQPLPPNEVADFTLAPMIADEIACVDWVFLNPPFKLALDFIRAATAASRKGFVVIARSAFGEGQDRFRDLWSVFPPAYELQFAERVVMLEGRLIEDGKIDPFAEKPGTKASTATAYIAHVWLAGQCDTRKRWLGPCRRRLERPGDYPDYSAELPAAAAEGLLGLCGAPAQPNRCAR